MTHRGLGRGTSEGSILLEDIVGSWAKEDEDVDDSTLGDP